MYAFDALLMLVVSVIFNIFHPLTYVNEAENRTDSQIPLAYTNGVPWAPVAEMSALGADVA